MAQSKVVSWFKGLFSAKQTEADKRPFAFSDEFIAEKKKVNELMKTGGPRAVKRYEAQKQTRETLKPSYPPTRPTDGYQPSARRFTAPPTPPAYQSDTLSRHDSGLTDALLIANLLEATKEKRHEVSPTVSSPNVEISVRDYTIDTPPPPAPAPSYSPPAPAPSYSAPPSYDSSPSYTSSDSYSSSSSYDSSSSSSSSFD